jgi:hypothetical protein
MGIMKMADTTMADEAPNGISIMQSLLYRTRDGSLTWYTMDGGWHTYDRFHRSWQLEAEGLLYRNDGIVRTVRREGHRADLFADLYEAIIAAHP